jgi:hypothetical protein
MKRFKETMKYGYRYDYFDTDISCFILKRIDDFKTSDMFWVKTKYLMQNRNKLFLKPEFYDPNDFNLKNELKI